MKTMVSTIAIFFNDAIIAAFPQLKDNFDETIVEITPNKQENRGHYQCNSAMRLTKILKKNPRDIAAAICENVDKGDIIESLDVAGPGFVNITIKTSYLTTLVQNIYEDPRLGIEEPEKSQKIVIDFSSPNTAKEMHVGHLRSTIIGDCLARLFEFLGHDVLRLNHIGDWGTAFGMLIAYMKEEVPHVLDGSEDTDLTHLVTWYKASKKRFDEDETFKKKSQQEVVALQSGDGNALKAWSIICEISRNAYQEVYDILDVKLIERGESFYNPTLAYVVADLENKGLVEVSGGAKCIFLEGFVNREGNPLPLMVQKSDGGYNYDTTDMAAIRQRVEEEHADRIIYVTDAGQATHFKMIFQAAEKAQYVDTKKIRLDHVPFGLVLGPDGKKFKTRSGETERLIDLLTNAVQRAKEILHERDNAMSEEDITTIAEALGIGSVKYADLSCHRTGDYTFSYERMLKFEGNTAAYLMYSYVRIHGIQRKINVDITAIKEKINLQHPSEISLGLHIARFNEALESITRDLLPNRLTDYLYNLAEKFNAFFRDCRVEGTAEQNQRLLLCETTAQIMRQGLNILGVTTVERM